MKNEISERLEKMESHIASLERQVEQLNEVITDQTKTIGKLNVQLRRLSQSLEAMEMDRIRSTNPKPPHYQ